MPLPPRLKHELHSLLIATAFFITWLGGLVILKHLLLAEYRISSYGFSAALIGALVLAKVVLILEHVPLGPRVAAQPAWVDLLLRTALYALGVLIVLILERGLKGMHEHHGFVPALKAALHATDPQHIRVNALCIAGALLVYNAISIIRRNLGEGAILKVFLTPPR